MNSTADILTAAQEIAQRAGQLLRDKQNQPRQAKSKGLRDIVTDADFASQQLITSLILERFPDHGFMAEEEDSGLPDSGPYIWVIDPIDGTNNYARGLGNYSISIAAGQQTAAGLQIRVGVIYDPLRDETFSALENQGATVNGRPLQVSAADRLIESIFSLDWSHDQSFRLKTLQILNKIAPEVRTVRGIGSAALAMAWIASGRIESYLNMNLYAWDTAAGQLLIKEAGGQVTGFENQPWHPDQRATLASNGHLHQDLLTLIAAGQAADSST